MNVLFFNPVGTFGGAERMLMAMMAALPYENPDIRILLLLGGEGHLVETAQKLGIKIKILPIPDQIHQIIDIASSQGLLKMLWSVARTWGTISTYLKALRQIIRELQPDLIHSNGIKSHILTAMVNLGIPTIWHIHDFYGTRPVIAAILRWYGDRVQLAIACSETVGDNARRVLPRLNIKVIYNAVDTDYFYPRAVRPSALDGFDLETKAVKVGMVGTFARWKGHSVFLEAIGIIKRERPSLNVQFYIIGSGLATASHFSLEELQRMTQDLGISDRVHFLGFQVNMADVYLWLDIVVHASTVPDPFGYAIAEAMACGRPVIVSRAGGAAELFLNDLEAVAFEPGDATILAANIQYLIANSKHCQTLGENARKKVVRAYNQNQLGSQLLRLYQPLLTK